MSAQGLTGRTVVNRRVDPAGYFGAPVDQIDDAQEWGLKPSPTSDLYRVSYLYLMVYSTSATAHSTGYGGFQVRGTTYLWLDDGQVPPKLQKAMQRAAHRGAYIFDSDLETPTYDGWLSGFSPTEDARDYRNWEVEPVGFSEGNSTQPGRVDWTLECYLEVDAEAGAAPREVKNTYAALAAVAQGVGYPWELVVVEQTVEAQQEWWEVTFNPARGDYDIHPPGRSASKERAKRLHGKQVLLNGQPIGTVTVDGRVWLKKAYKDGITYRGDHSKEGITQLTAAKPQSIRGTNENPGKLAKIDESPTAVHLATAQARPADFDPVDPEDVDPDRVIIQGVVRELRIADPDAPLRVDVRQDKKVPNIGMRNPFPFGATSPPYEHVVAADGWAWPGYRTVHRHGTVVRPTDDLDADQTTLGDLDGDDDGGSA